MAPAIAQSVLALEGLDVLDNRGITGGQRAFAGFLYQIVGTLGLRAWAECRDQTSPGGPVEGLLDFVLAGELHHELDENDAFVRSLAGSQRSDRILIQFKFSLVPHKDPLDQGDLAAICRDFARGIRERAGITEPVAKYLVVTNRPAASTLRTFLAVPPHQRQFDHLIRANKGSHRSRKNEDKLELLTAILQQTEVIAEYSFDFFEHRLRAFAAEYGVHGCWSARPPQFERDSEFEIGVRQLIGHLAQHASRQEPYPISAEYIAEAFCRYPAPGKLTVEAVDDFTRESRNAIGSMLGIHEQPVRRSLLGDVLGRVTEHAFLILSGEGGNGKSVLAWQMVQAAFGGSIAQHPVLATFVSSHRVEPRALSWAAGEWANVPPQDRTESHEEVIARLRTANPNAHPVLCLCLDGLDEVEEGAHRWRDIQDIVQWFWRQEEELRRRRLTSSGIVPPEATLVVTCRDVQEVINTWLQGSLSVALQKDPPDFVSVPEFSHDEILEAAQVLIPEQFARIQHAVAPEPSSFDTLSRRAPTSLTGPRDIHPEIIPALAHPMMWYAIGRVASEHAEALLDGAPEALDALASHVITWFVDKVSRRQHMKADETTYMLRAVAGRTSTIASVNLPYSIWLDCAHQAGLADFHGKQLYHEAHSAGIIDDVDPRKLWSWRHPFVARHLARTAQMEDAV